MISKKLIFWFIVLVLVVSVIIIWNKYQIQFQEKPENLIKFPSQISGECGIESCHGLDITCGSNIPESCNLMYMGGDNCRKFANCQTIDGQCVLKLDPKFKSCKSCVEKCERDITNDQIDFFQCESSCAE